MKGKKILIGTGLIAGFFLFLYLAKRAKEILPECIEGDAKCVGLSLYTCVNKRWVLAEENSPACGYVPPPPLGTGRIYGRVVEKGDTMIPIPDVLVTAGSYSTFSNANGDFELWVPIGSYSITLFKEGYGPIVWQRVVPSSGYYMGVLHLYLV